MSATFTIARRTEEIPELDRALGEFLKEHGVDGRPAYVAKLVLEEIARNLVEHATGPTEDWIRLDLDIDTRRLRLGLEDESTPFDPLLAPAPNLDSPLEERSNRGMGLHVVREMVDGMQYRRLADRNRLEVEIAL
jgi:anti-sigma regulatory factor (Ser/Thr protein kinase)